MIDNTKSHVVFAKDVLWVANLNKKVGCTQIFLCDGYYEKNQQRQI